MLETIALEPVSLKTVDEFKEWTRKRIRPIFPHETLACGYGHLHAGGVSLDYMIGVDYPVDHLQKIRNRAGGIDTPILRRCWKTMYATGASRRRYAGERADRVQPPLLW